MTVLHKGRPANSSGTGGDFVAFVGYGGFAKHTTALVAHPADQMERPAVLIGAPHGFTIHSLAAE